MSKIEKLRAGIAAQVFIYKELEVQPSFLEEIKAKYPIDYGQLFNRIVRLSDFGEIKDKTKFKLLDRNIYEIKTKNLRILCFFMDGVSPKVIILSNYFTKCQNKLYKKEIKKAINIRDIISNN